MPEYRRLRMQGVPLFFTVALRRRDTDLLVRRVEQLRAAVRQVRARRPFRIDAWVVLPEHMHCVWSLPAGDTDYPGRWYDIKATFSKHIGKDEDVVRVGLRPGERGIWQRRYWEHNIRDDADFARHIDYVHRNPVKHGLVERVRDWPYSTFHRYVDAGLYPLDWMTDDISLAAGEWFE
jgi:putative transposase